MEARFYDYVVLGSGIAGLTFALHAARHGTVAVVCKAGAAETNTAYAQGGIAAVLSTLDSFEEHVQDTLTAGAGLCDEAAVRFLVAQAPEAIQWLQQQGVVFDSNGNSEIALGLEGGHSRKRIAHVKDHTGLSIQQVLVAAAQRQENITFLEHRMGTELLTSRGNGGSCCYGVRVLDLNTDTQQTLLAKAVVLATGGAGQVFQHTTNPAIATGDGLAMAYRAGAAVSDMEFFQFHPTALYQPDSNETFLITEALRGAGAELVLPDGSRFMHEVHPLGSLAPRDIVARAVYRQMQLHNSPCLYLDARHLPADHVRKQFPSINAKCKSIGIAVEQDLIPIVPAAHYQCGGLQTDLHGCTTIAGLYAIGEVACTGVHGANRLASNSLLEGVVFGRSAARHSLRWQQAQLGPQPELPPVIPGVLQPAAMAQPDVAHLRTRLRELLWEKVGIVRNPDKLEQALHQVAELEEQLENESALSTATAAVQELRNLLTVATLVIQACLRRSECVGGHYVEADSVVAVC
ncbi:L-aspartate oxidase [Botryobacter ruber]|uniref:L-aspartate oxidase n=1 Tax=Botryobacter ruber TaxID=2171629 RepID=UPI000E0C1D08|nr:L-aspartate oxidase [Botryobacter ruber]